MPAATPEQSIAIILPAYNEELTIRDTILGFHRALSGAPIYVVNNNSKDATEAIARRTLTELGARGAVLRECRQGKGNAMRRAFLEIEADVYLLADADMTYPPEQAMDMLTPILEHRADMTVGDRHSGGQYARENDRPFHNLGNKLVQWLVNRMYGTALVDIMSGYRALSRDFVRSYPIIVEGFQIETDMTLFALQHRFRIEEVPIEYRNRPQGSMSKLNTFADGIMVLTTIFQIFRFYKPATFFSYAAALLALLGLLLGLPVIAEYLSTQFIRHIPLAILASAMETIAVLFLGVGLILDSIAYHRRLDSERDFQGRASRLYHASQNSPPEADGRN